MKKTRMYLALFILMSLLFSACSSAVTDTTPTGAPTEPPITTEAPAPTGTPGTTETLAPTETPKTTETLAPTETPKATEAPAPTKTPENTEAPAPTETPTPTKVPTPTEAPVPTQAPTPTETPVPTQAPAKSSDITYDFNDMLYLTSYGTTYSVQNDGSIELQYDGQYQEIKLTLPDAVDMNYCTGVTLKAKAEYSDISFKLYDEALLSNSGVGEVFVKYNLLGDGIVDYEFTTELTCDVHGIGIMALNAVDDFSLYKATVYSVTFHMMPGYNNDSATGDTTTGSIDGLTLLNTYGTAFGNMGTCVSLSQLQNNATLKLIKSEYNSVTSENDMKPDALLGGNPTLISVDEAKKLGYVIPDNYPESKVPKINFSKVDAILKICYENGLKYRAHTLVWHSQTPEWFFHTGYSASNEYVSKDVMNARMEFYIRTVMGHIYDSPYGSVVYSWDVVNEYLHADQIPNWITIYGAINTSPDYVKLAFEIADDVLKNYGIRDKVSLIFNDYNTYINTPKYVAIMEFINSDGTICDGFGMQAHLDIDYPSTSAFKNTVNTFLKTGLQVQITELDITINKPNDTSDARQAKYYCELMKNLLEIKKNGGNITGLTLWGLGDNLSWRKAGAPLLFTAPGRPKDMYNDVLQIYVDSGFAAD